MDHFNITHVKQDATKLDAMKVYLVFELVVFLIIIILPFLAQSLFLTLHQKFK